jgi:putative transposase
MRGSEFEITFAVNGVVRFSAAAGGRKFEMPTQVFMDRCQNKSIEIVHAARISVTAETSASIVRKHRYVESALLLLPHPTSRTGLREIIRQLAEKIADSSPPAPSTVIDWINAYKASGTNSYPSRPRTGNLSLRFNPVVEQIITESIKNYYLSKERFSAADVRAIIVGRISELNLCDSYDSEVKIPCERTIQKRISKIDPYLVSAAREGKDVANRLVRAAGRTIKSTGCLSIVEIDSHQLDIHVIDPTTGELLGKPYLTCIVDIYTRAIVGIYVSMYWPSALTALAALKDMVTRPGRNKPGGIPSMVVIDNGPEFKNASFQLFCERLKITISFSEVRTPNNKPHIEGFFSKLVEALIHKLPGTTFSNPNDRGEYDAEGEACFTLEQVTSYTEEWINEVHHTAINRITGRAPILAWEDQIKDFPPLSMSDKEVNAIARRAVNCTIRKGRILTNHLEYYSHSFKTLEALGEYRVTALIDDLDLSTVLVEDPTDKGSFIEAISTDLNYTTSLTTFAHQEAQKIKKELTRLDIQKLGGNANAIAKSRLFERIRSESKMSKKIIRKIRNGLGRKEPDFFSIKNFDSSAKELGYDINPAETHLNPLADGNSAISPESTANLDNPPFPKFDFIILE